MKCPDSLAQFPLTLLLAAMIAAPPAFAADADDEKVLKEVPSRRHYCPTDIEESSAGFITAFYVGGLACVLTGPLCMAGALLYAPIHVARGEKKDDASDKAWDAAVKLCDAEAETIDKPLRETWSAVCRSLARNLNFELLYKGDENGKTKFSFPVQMSDDITTRTKDGSTFRRLDPLMLTQHNLRWYGWRSCLSEGATSQAILTQPSLTFSQAVGIMATNIKKHGGKEMDLSRLKEEVSPQQKVDAAVAYVEARLAGRISGPSIDPDKLSDGDLRAIQILDTELNKMFRRNYYFGTPTASDLDVLAEFFILSAAHGEELLAHAKAYLPYIDSGKPTPAEVWESERIWKSLHERMSRLVGMTSDPFLLKDFVQGFHDAAEEALKKKSQQ
ncbi:MAG: hypothetical protein H6624_13055 [Bdellovibrionaceae bacterium]|nr:hypothetical protein [Bdellovibrionales bacterium]MCB9085271.1 hypothetical protein [Pseudobdellovibrionaceae bacterium]